MKNIENKGNIENNHRQVGKITAVLGVVMEVEFVSNAPCLYDVLYLEKDNNIKMEVVSIISKYTVSCVLLSLPYQVVRGDVVINSGEKLKISFGSKLLGNVYDMYGNSLLKEEENTQENFKEIRSPVKDSLKENIKSKEVLETGIKAIDFFAPLVKGGKIGLFGGAGVGKTVILTELINNLVVSQKDKLDTACVFCAVGERIREAHELKESLIQAGVMDYVAIVLGQMGESPVTRSRVPLASLSMVEHLNSLGKNVLFFMDNAYRFVQAGREISGILGNFPSEDGYQPSLTSEMAKFHERLSSSNDSYITAIEAVFVPSDDILDYGVRELFPYMDSFIILSREQYQKGIMPALDIMGSSSSSLKEGVVTKHHLNALFEARRVMEKAKTLERVVSLIGLSELSLDDQKIFKRANLIANYMTQPFFTVENQTGRKGQFVKIEDTVEDVMGIVEGKYDSIDSDKLLFGGKIAL